MYTFLSFSPGFYFGEGVLSSLLPEIMQREIKPSITVMNAIYAAINKFP